MRSPSAHTHPAAPATRALGMCGLARWLLVLLLVFDQVGAPWHAHRHDSGVDGSLVGAAPAHDVGHALAAETHTATEAHAPDERPSWTHAITVLRVEAGLPLAAAGADHGPVPTWPGVALLPTAPCTVELALSRQLEPARPAHRSLPPAPQAPPWRA